MTDRPDASQYASYFGKYITLVPDGDIVQTLSAERDNTLAVLSGVSAEKSLHRYASGKWSIRETYVHLCDAERVFAYRALRFARADQTPLASFEQDHYIGPSGADDREWQGIIEEYRTVREASISLFANLPVDAWGRIGTASGNEMSVRAIAYVIAGHDLHHRKLLKEKYL